MRKIVVSIENNEYKINYKEDIDKELAKKILKAITKYYSKERLDLSNEEYLTFSTKVKRKRWKIVVGTKEDIENNVYNIAKEIKSNTALFVDIDDEMYKSILENKTTFFTDKRMTILQILNMILHVAAMILGFCFLRPLGWTLLGQLLIDLIAYGYVSEDEIPDTWNEDLVNFFMSGIVGVIDGIGYNIVKKVKNIIGDIKNRNILKSIKTFFKNISIPKEFRGMDKKLKSLENMLEEDEINIEPYSYNPETDMNPINDVNSITVEQVYDDVFNRICELPIEKQHACFEELKKIIDEYKLSDIKSSDVVKNTVISNLDVLKNNITNELLYCNSTNYEYSEYSEDSDKQRILTRH